MARDRAIQAESANSRCPQCGRLTRLEASHSPETTVEVELQDVYRLCNRARLGM